MPSDELKECGNCKQMVPVNCCHWPCFPPFVASEAPSETPEPAPDTATLRAAIGHIERWYPVSNASAADQQADLNALTALRKLADALPSLIAAKQKYEQLELDHGKLLRIAKDVECRRDDAIKSRDVEWERAKVARAEAASLRAKIATLESDRSQLRTAILALPDYEASWTGAVSRSAVLSLMEPGQ